MPEKMPEKKVPEKKAADAKPPESKFLTYKGRPLVRSGNAIYYGSLADPYVVMLQIASTRPFEDMEMADKVIVALMSTDPDAGPLERIQQRCERRGLFNAIDIASVWLERALKKAA